VKAIVLLARELRGPVKLQTAGSKVRSFGQWAAANCAASPSLIADQHATSNC